ncbi:MAG: 3-oxoacyl-[acyl-carrier protein] reductase [uncultured Rubrobacteraceae bacterium]|uniref:3-oxoacyl-[acyl-carrier protein] reductase n=1 Tax=uncultured Rubrobacteraceae bacterium TaxID=349277 RepID=A0A6J4QZT3_9ACTN|nr:MAG: 3-oxoacyl-[acyl-carrier protein] reductase [uncultured Rubrobacteraceae bacterium]
MENNGFSLRDRVAVVTGGGQSLGLEISRALSGAGATVVVAEVNPETGADAAEELGGTFVRTDVTDPASVREMVAAVLGAHGRIDVLVNNAGVVHNIPTEEVPDEEWRKVMSVNLDGVFYCCREVGKAMLGRGSGAIVNIASMSGVVSNHPQPQAAYNASKAGVITLTKSLAGEWAGRGVRVNAVSPGYIRTPLTELGMSKQEWADVWLASTPMGRLAEPEEIAPAVLYLASDASSYATGTNLIVDGGYTSW